MSKTKTLFTMALLVLLGSMGAAQAQNFSEVKLFTTPEDYAREGGKNEAAGSILLNTSDRAAINASTIMLEFSVPLAADIDSGTVNDSGMGVTLTGAGATLVGTAEDDDDNDGNGTIMFSSITGIGDNLLIQGVKLDVSGADGPVTVTVSITAGEGDFIRIDGDNTAMVISGIMVGVEASAKASTVRTRGTGAGGIMTSLTLEESFKGAFMDGNMVTVEFSGIPKGATLTAEVTGIVIADEDADPPVVATAMDPYATVDAVKDGSATVTLGGTVDNIPRATPTSVTLELTLTANPGDDEAEISFPLDRSSVMAKAAFTDMQGGDDNFADAPTDYVTVFNIRPAQCQLLFPVVSVLGSWDTALSVTNPAYGDEMASGGLTFIFYGMDNPAVVYDTTLIPNPPGDGLEPDGTLSPGGTYQVLASEILTATDWGETFRGHVHLTADYTNCSGLGWVTDFMGVNQAYTATVIDMDTGDAN